MEIDGVYATRDFMDYDEFRQSRFFREWAEPNGFVDSCSSCLMKSPTRFAMATCLLPRLATARDYDLGRLFAPHLRRAVLISDLLDSQRLVVEERANTIDQLRVGVLIADSRCRITYANAAAEAMFAAGDPIRSTGGILSTRTTATTVVLRHAVEQGCREETSLGGSGIGIPALREDGSAAVIHILPLERRTGWRGDRTPSVAVFVATSEHLSSISGGAIAALFNLTTTEAQVLEKIAAGETAKKIAVQMGIAVSTVRTHLLRILDKTGTRRQAELVKLVHELSLPLVTPAGRATSSRTGQQA
jgi:DNA-binding CsgD family transcriptional regulator